MKLHQEDKILILPNVWDCTSAKMVEEAGFPAVATTSAGISWLFGFGDGEHIPSGMMIEMITRIATCVTIPVTADIEGGYYRNDTGLFFQFISQVVEAGAVGINLEDGQAHSANLNPTDHQTELIKLAKEAGNKKGIHLFVNARTDAMLSDKSLEERIQICIERAKAFEQAGADGIFIPFVQDHETVAQLKAGINLPLNILFRNSLDLKKLKKLKINRVSVGSRPMMAVLNHLKLLINKMKEDDDWQMLFPDHPSYEEINRWFNQN